MGMTSLHPTALMEAMNSMSKMTLLSSADEWDAGFDWCNRYALS